MMCVTKGGTECEPRLLFLRITEMKQITQQ